jgi:hypothetical protein
MPEGTNAGARKPKSVFKTDSPYTSIRWYVNGYNIIIYAEGVTFIRPEVHPARKAKLLDLLIEYVS